MTGVFPFHVHHAAHLKSHHRSIRIQSHQARRQPAKIGQMPNQHEARGFILQTKPHRLDVVVGRDSNNFFYPAGRFEARRQDFSGLSRAKFLAMFNAVEGETEPGEKIRHTPDRPPAFLSQAPLRIFGFRPSRSVLNEIKMHRSLVSVTIKILDQTVTCFQRCLSRGTVPKDHVQYDMTEPR
jgi:hypothetical protein